MSSDGARFGDSADSTANDRSDELLVLTSAPSRSSASASCCEVIEAVPSSITFIAKADRPRESTASDASPALNTSASWVVGTALRCTYSSGMPFASVV